MSGRGYAAAAFSGHRGATLRMALGPPRFRGVSHSLENINERGIAMISRNTTLAALTSILFATGASADLLTAPSQEFPTIQEAIDASGPGDSILIAAGTTEENLSIIDKDNLLISGDIQGAVIKGRIVVARSADIAFQFLGFEDDAENPGNFTCIIANSSRVSLSNCRFFDLDLDPVKTAKALQAQDSADISILACEFSQQFEALDVDRVQRFTMAGNRVGAGQREFSIVSLTDSPDLAMQGNVFARTFVTALGTERLLIEENTFNAATVGLLAAESATVASNKFKRASRDRGGAALDVAASPGASITSNRFRRTGREAGIRIDSNFVLIESNNLKKAGGRGIHLLQGGNVLRSNVAKRSTEFDLFDETGGQNALEDNTFGTTNL